LGLEDRDAFDPGQPVDAAAARIAIGAQPLVHIARTRVVSGHGKGVTAVVIAEHAPEIAATKPDIVLRIFQQRGGKILDSFLARLLARRAGHELHETARPGMADAVIVELALLPGDGVDHRPVASVRGLNGWETGARKI